ncbi:MAG TPA: restriction endonuclease subunit S [Rhodanobacter sp.]|nr:restriction endonuclease subunit S [Rhodanobacter sp.]
MSAVLAEPETTWRTVPLSEAVEISPKADRAVLTDTTLVSFVPMAAVGAGNGQIDTSTIRPYAEVKKGYTHFRDGDVLFAKITPCMENGKMAVAHGLHNGVGFGSTEFHVLRPRAGVDSRYVYHFVSGAKYRNEAAHHMTGAVGQKRVPVSFLERSEIPLPSLHEQRRIVAEIEKQFSRLDQAVASLQRVKAQLKRYKASVLKAAVEGRLVETEADCARREGRGFETGAELLQRILDTRRSQWKGKGKYKEPAAPETSGLPELPEGWVWCVFEQVSSADKHALKAGPFGSALKKDVYVPSGYKIYGQEQVIRGDHSFGDYFIEEAKFRELENCTVKPGDLLISLVGTAGKVLVLPENARPGIINPRLIKLSLNPSFIAPAYAAYMLQSAWAALFFKGQAHGGTMEILNLGIVKTLPVPLPPLREQHRIVAEVDRRLSIVREVEAEVDANLKRAQALRQAVLARAFAGTSS